MFNRPFNWKSLFAALAVSLVLTGSSYALDQSRPRNLAVSANSDLILVTSWGSGKMSQIRRGPSGLETSTPIDVMAKSWGVVMITVGADEFALVTHPEENYITRLQLMNVAGVDTFVAAGTIAAPRNCTEIIASPTSGHVLVAVAGVAPSGYEHGANAWRHTVIELDITSPGGFPTKTFIAEREPRALVLSRDKTKLFVGHIQGALGVRTDGYTFSGSPTYVHDGGSVLMFDYATQIEEERFPIGSPVRGLAIFPPEGAASVPAGFSDGHFLLYLTHTGDGSPSEHPLAGGKAIANVVTSIEFDGSNNWSASARSDAIFEHVHDKEVDCNPMLGEDCDPFDRNSTFNSYVLPEQLCFAHDGTNWRAFVTLSGSGGVGVATVGSDGRIVTSGSYSLDTIGDQELWVVTGRTGSIGQITTGDMEIATSSRMTLNYPLVASPEYVDVSRYTTVEQSSNPRGIAFDPDSGKVLVVTQFDADLVEITPATGTMTASKHALTSGSSNFGVEDDERHFFTRGRGFDFREPEDPDGGLTQTDAHVDNLTCATCHVDGHLDGKVRLSARPKVNVDAIVPDGTVRINKGTDKNRAFKPIAVPSVFDVGMTEWLFFEGIQTTFDADGGPTLPDCVYCGTGFAGIFTSTMDFTLNEPTPRSPYDEGTLTTSQIRGREVFEELNCVRCHAAPYDEFKRTAEPLADLPNNGGFLNSTFGPLPSMADHDNRVVLNDPTQVFLQGGGTLDFSRRNMTDVGTRIANDGVVASGVNTPSLAGAWNNAPYMHDGRYASLREVLENTWLDADTLAAPLLPGVDAFPDNFADSLFNSYTVQGDLGAGLEPHLFGTHKHDPLATNSVAETLPGTDVDALIDFMASLSSQSDIGCPGTVYVHSFAWFETVTDSTTGAKTLEMDWHTTFTASCEVTLTNGYDGSVETYVLPAGLSHSLSLTGLAKCDHYTVLIESISRVCGDAGVPYSTKAGGDETWNWAATNNNCVTSTLTWTTQDSVACVLEWGIKNQTGTFQYTVNTPAGYNHTAPNLPVTNGGRYMARLTELGCNEVSPMFYWNTSCPVQGPPGAFHKAMKPTGITAIGPNPANPRMTISFALEQPGFASLRVYDVRGGLVQTVVAEDLAAGEHVYSWNGTDNGGGTVASGVYFVRFEAGGVAETKPVTLLK